jgi:hypothetical protein
MTLLTSTLLHESDPTEHFVRERAYFLWIDRGCPLGDDLSHWFTAEQQMLVAGEPAAAAPTPAAVPPPTLTIRHTLAAHLADPAHRFHNPEHSSDERTRVVAGEARQRVRGRRQGGKLRAQPK